MIASRRFSPANRHAHDPSYKHDGLRRVSRQLDREEPSLRLPLIGTTLNDFSYPKGGRIYRTQYETNPSASEP